MAICKKCGNSFKGSPVIDGKKRNLRRRKYCLDCSPFGMHNTRPLKDRTLEEKRLYGCSGIVAVCTVCGKEYEYKRGKGSTTKRCGTCLVNCNRMNRKEKMINYKGGCCQVCGYKKCSRSLSFHHIDEEQKGFDISGNHCRKWETVEKELDKCILVCHNCHGEIHEGLINVIDYIK